MVIVPPDNVMGMRLPSASDKLEPGSVSVTANGPVAAPLATSNVTCPSPYVPVARVTPPSESRSDASRVWPGSGFGPVAMSGPNSEFAPRYRAHRSRSSRR